MISPRSISGTRISGSMLSGRAVREGSM